MAEENNVSQKKSDGKFAIIAIVLVLLLAIGGSVYYLVIKGDKKEKENKEEENPVLNYKLPVYQCSYGLLSEESMMNCEDIAFEIPTEKEDAKIQEITRNAITDEERYILYSDNGLKVYDVKTKEIEKLKLRDEYDSYELNFASDGTTYVGVIYYTVLKDVDYNLDGEDDAEYGYYNIKEDKKMYEKKYTSISPLSDNYIQAWNIKQVNSGDESDFESEIFVLDANNEKVLYSEKDAICKTFYEVPSSNGKLMKLDEGCVGIATHSFYTEDFKLIAKGLTKNQFDLDDNNNLYVLGKNKVVVYNPKGEVVKQNNTKGKVQHVFKDYYLTIDNNKLMIKDYGSFSKNLRNWKSKNYYHWMISGYYGADVLDNEQEKEAGYYFIVEENGSEEGAGVEYYFNPKTKKLKSWKLEYVGGYAKPVLYLYPEKETKVEVNFEHEDSLTTTYPKFKDSWKVTASPNGDLYDEYGKYYYGLYWEEEKNHTVSFDEGFYVTKENAIKFLEEKTSIIGLNDRERNEFIMYWLPILEKNEKSLVYFELTEEREEYNKLYISPAPDSLLRVAIHVKKVDKITKIKEQKLKTFERKGFTAVEWGGVLYK